MHIRSSAVWLLVFCAVSAAHASAPAGELFCVPAQGNSPSASPVPQAIPSGLLQGGVINLSYVDLGAVQTGTPNSGTGSGLGKPVWQPVVLRTAPETFVDFYSALFAGDAFSQCSLNAIVSNGVAIRVALKLVTLESVHIIASSATLLSPRSVYVETTLSYAAIDVEFGQD
jgi:hypothetical protein